jgi:hypothetical protein
MFMILTDHSWLHIVQPRKMEMLFDHIRRSHCILDEAFDVEVQTILVLIQIVEANGTLQPMHDSRKYDGADGAVVVATSDGQACWPSSSSLSSFSAASFSAASFSSSLLPDG